MTSLSGFPAESFDNCYSVSPSAVIENIPVKFLHINQLIEAKKASGRTKDLLDVEELETQPEAPKSVAEIDLDAELGTEKPEEPQETPADES